MKKVRRDNGKQGTMAQGEKTKGRRTDKGEKEGKRTKKRKQGNEVSRQKNRTREQGNKGTLEQGSKCTKEHQ